jgi:hypothetical protein
MFDNFHSAPHYLPFTVGYANDENKINLETEVPETVLFLTFGDIRLTP